MTPLTPRRSSRMLLMCLCVLGAFTTGHAQTDLVSLLIDQMNDTDASVRHTAAETLVRSQDARAVAKFPSAVNAFQSNNSKDPVTVELVVLAAVKEPDVFIRQGAALSLRGSQDPRVIDLLVAQLRDSDAKARFNAVQMLRDTNVRSPRAVEPLIAALSDTNAGVRLEAVLALGDIKDPRLVDLLIAALKDNSPNVRAWATVALRDTGDLRAVDPLIGGQ
jgi:HEAT repeat protein